MSSEFVMARVAVVLGLFLLATGCTPTSACGPDSCFGCCTAEGECVGGKTDTTCGLNGVQCASCLPGTSCRSEPGNTACMPAGGGGGGSSDAGFIPKNGVALAVLSAKEMGQVGDATAPTGKMLVPVSLRIGNGEPTSISLSASRFTFRSAAGLDYAGSSWITQNVSDPCPQDAMLAPEAELRCGIGFEVPSDTEGKSLLYALPDGGVAQVPLTVEPCASCGGRCVDLQSDPDNCGSCGNVVGDCHEGVERCPAGQLWCGEFCVALQPGANACSPEQISCNTLCGNRGCFRGGAIYSNNGCMGGTYLECDELPPETFWDPGCSDMNFHHLECECAN